MHTHLQWSESTWNSEFNYFIVCYIDGDLYPIITLYKWCPGLLVTKCTECTKFTESTIDCNSLLNDQFCVLVADSYSAPNWETIGEEP
uniref:Apple domain-containing protein n=1 Tax=Heterorhabditis bacteriophora TaxID=37862 RepID=A0A1I7XV47_HETBA